LLVTRAAADGAEHVAELVQRGNAQLEQEPRDPRVVVGAGPAGVGVLPGQERRELAVADPRGVVGRFLRLGGHGGWVRAVGWSCRPGAGRGSWRPRGRRARAGPRPA